MKKMKYLFLIVTLILNFIILSSCYGKSGYLVLINDIKVYDQDMNEIETEELYNNEIHWFLNDFNNGLKPINSPAPRIKYTGFEIINETSLTIKVYCSSKYDYELTFNICETNQNNGEQIVIQPELIEKENLNYVVTFKLENLPTNNTNYDFVQEKFIKDTGEILDARLDYSGSNSTGYYGGLVVRINELYIPYRNALKNLNNNLTTEFKLYANVSELVRSIRDDKNTNYAINYYYTLYNKVKYHDYGDLEINESTFLNDELVYYGLSAGIYGDMNIVLKIFSSDPTVTLFGLSFNNTFEEVEEVLSNNNYVKINQTTNGNYLTHVFQSELDFINISYYYSYTRQQYIGFKIEINYIFY